MKAFLKNYRQSPRKVRLIADLIRGKRAIDALTSLRFAGKRAASPIKKLLESAIANAKENNKLDKENLFIKEIRVDQGVTLKRHRPRAHGRSTPINKRTSHVNIVLGEKIKSPVKKAKKVIKNVVEKVEDKKEIKIKESENPKK